MAGNNGNANKADIGDLKDAPINLPALLADTGTDIAAAASAAYGKSMVEARYIMALKRPRNMDQVRLDILAECKRPAFAHNKSAYYVKPIGDGVEGLGIRFAEVAIRHMTNVLVEAPMVYEDAQKEVHRVILTDLEANATYTADVRVGKNVERAKPMEDGGYVSVRKNSYGKNVYTVPGTEDDLLNKRAAQISKAIRTLALRIIPGDIQDEAEATIKAIRLDKAAKDPSGERKAIADGFAELGVRADQLVAYLDHTLDTCSPAELVKLRGIYGAIRDGEATWVQVMQAKEEGTPAPKKEKKDEKDETKGAKTETKEPPTETKTEKSEPPPAEEKKPRKRRGAANLE
jgi:hypothetical protein